MPILSCFWFNFQQAKIAMLMMIRIGVCMLVCKQRLKSHLSSTIDPQNQIWHWFDVYEQKTNDFMVFNYGAQNIVS